MSDLNFTEQNTQAMVRTFLNLGPTTVTFTKKDGTERIMRCTLSETLIPASKAPKTESTKKSNDSVQPVFDLDINDWRSFSWSSIVGVSV